MKNHKKGANISDSVTVILHQNATSVTQCMEPTDLEHSDEIETLWVEGESVNYTTIIK